MTINYDHRESTPTLENSVEALTAAFEDIQVGLRRLLSASSGQESALFDKEVELEATTPVQQKMRTTVGRELWCVVSTLPFLNNPLICVHACRFASLHSIHHYALARVILVNELKVKVGSEFGYAPSTLTRKEYRRRQQQQQQEAQQSDSRHSKL